MSPEQIVRHPDLVVPLPPFLMHPGTTPEEAPVLRSVADYLMLLHRGVDQLVSAISLFEFCRANDEVRWFSQWVFIAGRDGAMSINNMAMGLHYARRLIGSVASSRPHVDFAALKEAENLFREKFPNAEKMRHAVAHQEFYSNPNRDTRLAQVYDDGNMRLGALNNAAGNISDDAYTTSWQGEMLKYHLNATTALDAVTVCKRFFSGFKTPGG